MNKKNNRFYEIDLLRFLAAMAVVMFHYTFRGYIEGGYSSIEYPLIGEFSRYGYLGIHLFFMISGFVILLSAMKRNAIQFAIARFIRLYPAFWAGVSLSVFVIYFFGDPKFAVTIPQYLINMTMLSGYTSVEYIDNVYWTLLVEIKFYLLVFLLLMINKIKQIEIFLGLWLALIIIHTFIPLDFLAPLPRIIDFFFFPEWALYFIAGSLFYLIYAKGINLSSGVMLICTYLLIINLVVNNIDIILQVKYKSSFSKTIPAVIISVYFLVFTMIALNKTAWLRSPKLVYLGVLTYPLYLIHQNIGYIAFNTLGAYFNKYYFLAGLIAVILLVAWLIHYLIEKKLVGVLYNKTNDLRQQHP